jgi:hypothetical protein
MPPALTSWIGSHAFSAWRLQICSSGHLHRVAVAKLLMERRRALEALIFRLRGRRPRHPTLGATDGHIDLMVTEDNFEPNREAASFEPAI